MQHIRRIVPRLWAALLVAALALPALSIFTPGVEAGSGSTEQVSAPPRFHPGGWMDSVPPGERADALKRLDAKLAERAAQIEQRPPVDAARQSQTTAQWTVLVYMAADNNLENAALADVNEMEYVGSSSAVNVVIQLDRSADYSDLDGNWSGGRRYLIQQDEDLETINSTMLQNLGPIDSGDPAVLTDFLIWGITSYPAQKYMLVLWDHGGGWIVNSADEDTGDDFDLPEVSGALSQAISQTGIGQFEVIGFDMCLMGQLEVFSTVAPYARYAVGAEEVVPGPGWFYVFLDDMEKDPSMDGARVGTAVVDYFMQFYDEIYPYEDFYDMAAVDLSQVDNVHTALDQLTTVVEASPEASLSAIADARNNVIGYGGYDDPQYFDVWSSVDLYGFADLLNGISVQPQVQQAAQGVTQAVDQFIVHEGHNQGLDGSHGLAIYFPRTLKAYKIGDFNVRYPQEMPASMGPWIAFLDVFHGTAAATVTTAPSVLVTSVYPDVVSIYQPAIVTLDISGRDILQVNYAVTYIESDTQRMVLDFDYLVSRTTAANGADIVNWSDGVTSRTFAWDAEVPILTDGTVSTYALLIPNRDNPDIAIVNGMYTSVRGGDPIQSQLVFDLNRRESTGLWGITESANGSAQPYEIQPEAGDQFQPVLLTMDANNELTGTSLADTLTLGGEQPITFQKVPAPTGNYSISFVAGNVAGQTTLAEALIQVNNDGLDANLRGYTDTTYGVNFRYPASWIRPRFTPDGTRLFTADLATNTILTLYPYTEVTSAEETATAVKQSWSQLDNLQTGNERPVTINGLPAYVLDYTYSYQGQPRVGAVIAIYVPDQQVGYGFDLDAPADNPAPAQEALADLVDSINFFAPTDVVGQSAWTTVTSPDGSASFPVPSDWAQASDTGSMVFSPKDEAGLFLRFFYSPATGSPKDQLAQSLLSGLQAQSYVTNLQVQASQLYYVGNEEWYLIVYTYDDALGKRAGAFFATTDGQYDHAFWIEGLDAEFDQAYQDYFSVMINGFTRG